MASGCAGIATDTEPTSASDKPVVVSLVHDAEGASAGGQHDRAIAYLERALRIEPRNPRLWHQLAQVRLEQGRYQQAVHLAARSNALAGKDKELKSSNWELIADAYELTGDVDRAQSAREKARR